MMAKVFDLTCWPVTIVPESELSHTTTVHHGFVPKLSHHGGKTIKTMSYRYTVPSSMYQVPSYSMRSLFFSDAIAERGFFLKQGRWLVETVIAW